MPRANSSDGDDAALPTPEPSTDKRNGELLPGLPDEVRELLNDLPEDDLERLSRIASSFIVSSHHEGPLPSSQTFEHYERVLPGAASEIIGMAKEEQSIKKTVLAGRVSNDRMRLANDRLLVWVLMVLAVGMVGLTGLAVWLEQPYVATFLVGLSAVVGIGLRLIDVLSKKKGNGKSDE